MCLAVPGQIVSIEGEGMERLARVRFCQIVKEANVSFVPEAGIGDYILVHAGVAISRVNEDEAQKTFAYLDEIGEVQEQLG